MSLQTKDFSVTGKSAAGTITYTYTLRVTEESVDTYANTSRITVEAILRQNYSGTAFSSWYTGVSCVLNGEKIFSDYVQRRLSGTDEHVFYTWTGDIPHDDDGNAALSVTGKLWQSSYADFSPPEMTVPQGVMALTPIARSSRLMAIDAPIGQLSMVAVLHPFEGCTHTVRCQFGDFVGYLTPEGELSDTPAQLTEIVVYWTVPEAFYGQIPNQKEDLCHLECVTYYKGKPQGEPQTLAVRFYAVEADCVPSLSPLAQDVNEATLALTGDPGRVIPYHSILRCSPGLELRHYATAAEVRVNGAAVEGAFLDIPADDTGVLEFYARDSRGFEATAEQTLQLIPYEKPTHRVSVSRPIAGDDQVRVTVTGRFCPCDFGLQQNQLGLRYRLGSSGHSVIVPITPDETGAYSVTFYVQVDYTKSARIYLDATDLLETVTVYTSIQPGDPVFHWDASDFTFCVPVTAKQSVSGLFIRAWAGQKWLKTKFPDWDAGGQTQAALVFGSIAGTPVLGNLLIQSDGACAFQGAGELTLSKHTAGRLRLPELTEGDSLSFLCSESITLEGEMQ